MMSGEEHSLPRICCNKLGRLKDLLRDTGGCAIAYSGGDCDIINVPQPGILRQHERSSPTMIDYS